MDTIWSGPKICPLRGNYVAYYNLQVDRDEIPDAVLEIESLLRPNEFRKTRAFSHLLIYQFFYPVSKNEYQSYQKGITDLKKTTGDILEYAKNRAINSTQSSALSQPQLKNRQEREQKWKKWYQDYLSEHQALEKKHEAFYKEKVTSQTLSYAHKLLDFQVDHVKNLLACLKTNGTTLDASDTGTGKTYSALCLCRELGLMPIIVCPKSVIPRWEEAAEHFGLTPTEFYVANYEKFRAGTTPYLERLKDDNPNYQQLMQQQNSPQVTTRSWQQVNYDRQRKLIQDQLSKVPQSTFRWKLDAKKHLLIFDECHKVKNAKTLNYSIYWWAKQQKLKVISLSATVADKISNAYSIAYMLDLATNSKEFRQKYQQESDGEILKDFGYEISKDGKYRFNDSYRQVLEEFREADQNLRRLHDDIFPLRGARMIIEEMGQAFPDNFVDAQTFEMDQKAEQIQAAYQEMEKNILQVKLQQARIRQEQIDDLTKLQKLDEITPEELLKLNRLRREKVQNEAQLDLFRQKLSSYGSNIQPGHLLDQSYQTTDSNKPKNQEENILTIRLRAWQRVELLKADTLVDLTKEFLEEGKSIVIFVNFNDTLDYLKDKLSTVQKEISIIRGGQTVRERQRQIDLFQKNTHRIIISNIRSGGVGISLHDLQGDHPRVSLISPSWSAQDLVQALGRIHRAEGKSKCQQYLIFCARTIEDQICSAIKKKLKTIKAINDGDLTGNLIF